MVINRSQFSLKSHAHVHQKVVEFATVYRKPRSFCHKDNAKYVSANRWTQNETDANYAADYTRDHSL